MGTYNFNGPINAQAAAVGDGATANYYGGPALAAAVAGLRRAIVAHTKDVPNAEALIAQLDAVADPERDKHRIAAIARAVAAMAPGVAGVMKAVNSVLDLIPG